MTINRTYNIAYNYRLLSLLLSISMLLVSTLNAQKSEDPIDKSIPVIDLLKQLQTSSGLNFIFDQDLLDQQFFTLSEEVELQLNHLLLAEISKQTSLQFQAISKKTFVVKKRPPGIVKIMGRCQSWSGKFLEGANICVKGKTKGTITHIDGSFELALAPGKYLLSASFIGYETMEVEVWVDGYQDQFIEFRLRDHLKLEEILVVGNRFYPKTIQETAVPVDVISSDVLEQKSQQSLTHALQYEAASFHSTSQTISDGTDHVDPISLKGLGPDQLLVLVNGKRRHASSLVNVNGTTGRGSVGTDLNAIPLLAIKKIEILKDGATAMYGSDAIAGVINLHLKDQTDQGSLQIQTGISEQGDGAQLSLGANYGFPSFKKGLTNLSFYFRSQGATNRTGAYQGPIYGNEKDEDPVARNDFFKQTGFSGERVMTAGSAAITNTGIFMNSEYQLNDHTNIYTNGSFNYRSGLAGGFYRFPYQERKQSGIYPMGFSPNIQSNILDFSNVLGINSAIKGWEIDFSNNFGRNSFNFHVNNSNNASLGLQSPTAAYAGGFSYLHNLINLDIKKRQLGQAPIHLAFGSEIRLEQYTQREGAEVSWKNYGDTLSNGQLKEAGIQVFPGFRPENAIQAYRHNMSFYTEVESDITPLWLFGLAGRYESYSDFGSQLNWKVSTRYRVRPYLTLRSTFNTGFRAPSLQQSFFSSHSLQFLPQGGEIVATEVAHINHNSPIIRRLDIPALKPEKSQNFSIGLATHIWDKLRFTADAYQITIRDRIVLSGQIAASDDDQVLKAILKDAEVDKIQFFTNAIQTKTWGLDSRLQFTQQFKKSRLDLTMAWHANQTKVGQKSAPTALLGRYQDVIFSREEIGRLERSQPASKMLLSINYHFSAFSIHAQSTRFGRVAYIHPGDAHPENWVFNQYTGVTESRDQVFSAQWISDLGVQWELMKNLNLSLWINNLFDIYPDQHRHFANTHFGVLLYSRRVQQFGTQGRRWEIKALYKI